MKNSPDKPDMQLLKPWREIKIHYTSPTLKMLTFAVLALQLPVAYAQQSIKLGDTNLTPALRLEYATVDNTFRSPNDTVDSTGLIVSPSVSWVADRRLLQLTASYNGNYGVYDESVLDFADHRVGFRVISAPRTRHRLTASLFVDRGHEEVGTGQTRFVQNLDDQIETTSANLLFGYVYGAANAKGNLGTGIVLNSDSFDNFEELTEGDDNTEVRPYLTFTYRLSPDVRLVAETRYGVVDYDDNRRDRSEISFLTGLDLNATARTGGRIRLGVTEADYDTQGVRDTSTFVADIDVFFSPRQYSRFNVSFNRDLNTVDDDENSARQSTVDTLELSWSQEWSGRLSTRAGYELEVFDRPCPNNGTDTGTLSLEVGVNIRRWISVGLNGSNSQRTVSDCSGLRQPGAADYDVNTVGVFMNVTL